MSTPNESNTAASFISIRKLIARGLRVFSDRIRGFLQRSFQGEGIRNFQDMQPEAPSDRLMADQQKMAALLEEIRLAQEKCEKNEGLENPRGILENGISWLDDAWHPQLQTETDEFIAKADASGWSKNNWDW